MQQESKPKKKKLLWIILLILSLLVLFAGCFLVWRHFQEDPFDPKDYHVKTSTEPAPETPDTAPLPTAETPEVTEASEHPTVTEDTEPIPDTEATEIPTETEAPPLPDNPIDFDGLHEINTDVYAWIYIPMGDEKLDIDHPILQSRSGDNDDYYLHHNIYRKYQFSGCIYTQHWNNKEFTDRVTVVYGHNMLNGTMFTNLVYFLKKDFFNEHDVFYIYTPGHILTYRIAAAIQFDDRHLLNCFDFSDDEVYQNWIDNYILNPRSVKRAYREDITVTTEDKLVILSTCLEHGKYRLLVQGVLIDDEPTN